MKPKTILFIHGMFMTSLCWEGWVSYFSAKGYRCIAPDWPGRDAPAAELRARHPDAELGNLTFKALVDYHGDIVRGLAEPPIIIGHSMGALITQVLLNRGLGAAGVALDSAPPTGVFSVSWSFLKSNFTMINPFISKYRPHMMSFKQFQYAFVNTQSLDEQRAAYDRYAVPESRALPRSSLGADAKIDFTLPHKPLLMTSGSADHIIPASLNLVNYRKYAASPSVTDFIEFPGRNHFLIVQPGWREIAAYVSDWIDRRAG